MSWTSCCSDSSEYLARRYLSFGNCTTTRSNYLEKELHQMSWKSLVNWVLFQLIYLHRDQKHKLLVVLRCSQLEKEKVGVGRKAEGKICSKLWACLFVCKY